MATAFKSVPPEIVAKFCDQGALDNGKRRDGRDFDQLRHVFMKAGTVYSADGSAYIEVGNTKLICTVNGPHELSRSSDFTSSDYGSKSNFVAKVHFVPFARKIRLKRKRKDQETDEELSLGRSVTEAFLPSIRLDQYPKSQIDAYINVLEDDGAVLSAALTCCSIALVDAGIELCDIVIGASARIANDTVIVDPNSAEESYQSINEELAPLYANVTLGLMPSLNQVSLMNEVGEMKHQTISKVMKTLTDCCYKLFPSVQETIVKSFKLKSKTFLQ